MPVITKIESQKNGKRVNIYVDGEYFLSMDMSLVYKLRVQKGEELDRDRIKEFVYEDDFIKAKNKALNSLSRSYQSEKRLRQKLLLEFDIEIVDRVVEFLKEYGFIDDKSLGKMVVRSGQNSKKIGKRRILQELAKKGIDKKYTEELIEDIDDESELENARYVAEKKLSKIKDTDKNTQRRKLYQHMSYKGFEYNVINRVIRELLD